MIVFRPTVQFAASHPAHIIAFGFGSGLVPIAPGTAGTLVGWAIGAFLGASQRSAMAIAVIGAAFLVGVWACEVTGRRLGVPDHGAMVWDEIVAFVLVIAIVPGTLAWQLSAFALFRFFDILKPPPIRWFERRYHGGFGVMFDDLLAAGYTLMVLALFKRIFL
jgi:phosphatidylglycerophosphatase A